VSHVKEGLAHGKRITLQSKIACYISALNAVPKGESSHNYRESYFVYSKEFQWNFSALLDCGIGQTPNKAVSPDRRGRAVSEVFRFLKNIGVL